MDGQYLYCPGMVSVMTSNLQYAVFKGNTSVLVIFIEFLFIVYTIGTFHLNIFLHLSKPNFSIAL